MKIAIDGEWYDLEKWAPFHPGGKKILERFDRQNATEHFYSLHSKKAIRQLKRMKPAETKEGVPDVDPIDLAFHQLRDKLEAEGWYERHLHWDILLLIPIVAMCVLGTSLAWSHPITAIVILGVAMQQAGWLGHDMVHARNSPYNETLLRYVSGWINGFDRNWWSDKHNTHHVLTNHANHDPDIHVQPLLFLWPPLKKLDHHFRRYQHFYFLPIYTLIYVSWRIGSLQWTFQHRDWKMFITTLLPSYIWLGLMPLHVSVGSVLFGGLLVSIVVTLSHESEPILTTREPSFVKTQFDGTRNIECPDWFTEYLFGGMQYQLEHHLFPTLPRYKYRVLKPIVQQFAKENGLEYKSDGLFKMLQLHYNTLKKNAHASARPHDKDEYLLQ